MNEGNLDRYLPSWRMLVPNIRSCLHIQCVHSVWNLGDIWLHYWLAVLHASDRFVLVSSLDSTFAPKKNSITTTSLQIQSHPPNVYNYPKYNFFQSETFLCRGDGWCRALGHWLLRSRSRVNYYQVL